MVADLQSAALDHLAMAPVCLVCVNYIDYIGNEALSLNVL